jgi:hypothetical protein
MSQMACKPFPVHTNRLNIHCIRLPIHINMVPRHINRLTRHANSPHIHGERLQYTLRGLLTMVIISQDMVTGFQDIFTGSQHKLTALKNVHRLSWHVKSPIDVVKVSRMMLLRYKKSLTKHGTSISRYSHSLQRHGHRLRKHVNRLPKTFYCETLRLVTCPWGHVPCRGGISNVLGNLWTCLGSPTASMKPLSTSR